MAAAPKNGTMTFVGASGQVYNVDCYISDVAAARVTFDSGGAAASTSLTYWVCPEQCTLTDFSVVTGLTDTTNISLLANSAIVPNVRLRYANFLNTLTSRPPIRITFKEGTQFSALQAA